MNRFFAMSCVALMCMLLAAPVCAETKTTEQQTWYRIHFGMGTGSGSVTPEKMAAFITKELAPRFPRGFTESSARGQWLSQSGVIKERTIVVDVQCDSTPANQQLVDEVAAAFLKAFTKAKNSVFVVRVPGVTTQLMQ